MPRAALLSIHARVEGTEPDSWEDPSLVQLWGPRFSAYVVAERDRAVFTVGRLPDDPAARRDAEQLADRLEAFLDGRRMTCGEAGRGLGRHPSSLRYAAPTGRVVMRWDGARQPTIWTVPPPTLDPGDARLELARRYLHVFGPATAEAFAEWAGIAPARGRATFDALAGSLTPVRTPVGDAWILTEDAEAFRNSVGGDVASDAAPPQRRRVLPAPGSGSGTARPRSWPAPRALDTAGLAGCRCGRRRGGRDVAAGWSGRHDPDVAASLAGGPRGGRARGAVVPLTRRPGPDPRSMGDVTRALALEFGPASVSARSLVAEGSVFQRPDGDLGRPHDQSGNCRDLDGPACRSPTGWMRSQARCERRDGGVMGTPPTTNSNWHATTTTSLDHELSPGWQCADTPRRFPLEPVTALLWRRPDNAAAALGTGPAVNGPVRTAVTGVLKAGRAVAGVGCITIVVCVLLLLTLLSLM